jgi:hypothetical protein
LRDRKAVGQRLRSARKTVAVSHGLPTSPRRSQYWAPETTGKAGFD